MVTEKDLKIHGTAGWTRANHILGTILMWQFYEECMESDFFSVGLLGCGAFPIHMQIPTLWRNLLPPYPLICWCLTWHSRTPQSQKDDWTIHKLKGDIISYPTIILVSLVSITRINSTQAIQPNRPSWVGTALPFYWNMQTCTLRNTVLLFCI